MEDFSFSYGADSRLIRLSKYSTSFSPKEYDISYDDVGNPCVYKDNVLKWERGRLLAAYGDNKYSYDADGVRIKKKTANGVLHKYFTEGTRIHHEEYGTHENWYYYDATGIVGIEHDGVRYYFQKNIQGDVARIFNANGYLVARYVYDAWGNHTVYDANGNINTDENSIGNINPFRYRGYYYDVETGLYYLNTRYYDPFACRFINADDISYIEPETINGLNLYSYCGNNPINGYDPYGTWDWGKFWGILGMAVGTALFVVAVVASAGTVGALVGVGAAAIGFSATAVSVTATIATISTYAAASGIALFGISDIIEVGSNGFNPIRDVLMGKNQTAYNVTKGIFVSFGIFATIAGSIGPKILQKVASNYGTAVYNKAGDLVGHKLDFSKKDWSARIDAVTHGNPKYHHNPHVHFGTRGGAGKGVYYFWEVIRSFF